MTLLAALHADAGTNHAPFFAGAFPEDASVFKGKISTFSPSPSFAFATKSPEQTTAASPLSSYRDPERGLSTTFLGRLFNARDLSRALGETTPSGTPAELLARAWLRWGTDCLARLRGEFVLIAHDERNRSVVAARDRFGTQPLYFTRLGNGIAFASLAKQLFGLRPAKPGPNESHLYKFIVGELPKSTLQADEETFFKDIYRVKAGHYVRYSEGKIEHVPYWNVTDLLNAPKNRAPAPSEYLSLLESVIREQAGDFAGVASALSGGLDSTAILMMLDRIAQGRGVSTISLAIDGMAEQELEGIRLVLECANARHTWVRPDNLDMFSMFAQSAWHQEVPSMSPSSSVFYVLKREARDHGVDILFSGLGADEVLGGMNLGYLADLFYGGRWMRMARELTAYTAYDSMHYGSSPLRIFREHVLDPAALVRRRRHVPSWINPDLAAAHREVEYDLPLKNGVDASAFDLRTCEKLMRNFTQTFLQFEIHNAAVCGIEHRFPFLDPRIVQYSLQLPWHERISGGIYKIHHRKALEGILPERVRAQVAKAIIPGVHNRWLTETYRRQVDDLIFGSDLRCARYLNLDAVRAEHRAYVSTDTNSAAKANLRRSTWRTVALELWLRAFQY